MCIINYFKLHLNNIFLQGSIKFSCPYKSIGKFKCNDKIYDEGSRMEQNTVIPTSMQYNTIQWKLLK